MTIAVSLAIAAVTLVAPGSDAPTETMTITQLTRNADPYSFVSPIGISSDGRKIAWIGGPSGNSTPRYIWAGNADGTGVRQIASLACTYNSSEFCEGGAISGDGTRLAFSSCEDPLGANPYHCCQIFTYELDSGQLAQATPGCSTEATHPDLDADGSLLVYQGFDGWGSNIYAIFQGSGAPVPLDHPVYYAMRYYPRVDSSGSIAVFGGSVGVWKTGEAFEAATNGSGARQLTSGGGSTVPILDISGNGRWILFYSGSNYTGQNPPRPPGQESYQLFVLPEGGGAIRQLTDAATVYFAQISGQSMDATGQTAAFVEQYRDYTCSMQFIDTQTGSRKEILPRSTSWCYDGPPYVSADAKVLLFASHRDLTGQNPAGLSQLFILRIAAPPPIAEAGPDQMIECTGAQQATVTLDGSASADADSIPGNNDDIVRFDWSEGGAPLASGMIVSVPFDLGTHDITLTVTDRTGATASDDTDVTVVDTTPPSITCPASVTAECQAAGQAYVGLAAATASDLCHGTAAITNDRTTAGADASGSYPLGTTVVTFTATDGSGNHASCRTSVTVRDTIPPVATVVASPNVLWPPNHKMTTVNTTVVATDTCDPSPRVELSSVVSSEPDDAPGDGDGSTTDDIGGAAIGTPDFEVLLRAERDGNGPGRTYTVTYQASDHSGNAAVAMTEVVVPHDMGQGVEPLNLLLESARSTTLIWSPVDGAREYDVIRGDSANLRIDGSDIDLGQVTCVAQGITGTTTAGYEDTAVPEPGQVFFYVVQYNDGTQDSSYGSESAGKARVVSPGDGDCH